MTIFLIDVVTMQAKGAADAQKAKADGELYAALKVADPTRARYAGESKREAATGSAEAARIIAQGEADAMRIQAEAKLFAQIKKSEGQQYLPASKLAYASIMCLHSSTAALMQSPQPSMLHNLTKQTSSAADSCCCSTMAWLSPFSFVYCMICSASQTVRM